MPDRKASQTSTNASALLLCGMQFAVFERLASGIFVAINSYPGWFLRLTRNSIATDPAQKLTECFPALEGFLPIAKEFWVSPSTEQLQSDFWTEVDSDGHEYHLLAFAVTADDRHFLVLERADATYVERQQLQLYAHEMVIQYDTIAHLNQEVERATRAKTDFLATMSHEIRTPLNAILGMADLLAETTLNADQRKYVEVFQRAGGNLLGLINNILDLSKVEAGHLELESVDFELNDVIERALDLTRVRAASKGLDLGCSIQAELPHFLTGDPLRLRQILLNLLGNALKFTDAGRLDVEVQQDPSDSTPGALLFRVRDTGIGIPQEKLGSIFENFSQADSSTTRKYGGTGLGLAISKRLIELMGGRVWVESVIGQGSSFLFTARFAVPAVTGHAVHSTPPEAPSPVAPAPAGLTHVLLADDSEDNRFLIREYLKHSTCTLDMAENGEEALARIKSGHYDLVLMDAHMPVMDGYTATRAIRAWEAERQLPPLPILALTADAFKEAVQQSHAAGFDAHLTKPIQKSTLMNAIERFARVCHREPVLQPANPPAGIDPSIAALAPRYLTNIRKSLEELRAANATADYATIQRIGHNMHGNGASFGFPRITQWGAELEQAAKSASSERVGSAFSGLQEYLQQLSVQ